MDHSSNGQFNAGIKVFARWRRWLGR
jgi:hypothetical protein